MPVKIESLDGLSSGDGNQMLPALPPDLKSFGMLECWNYVTVKDLGTIGKHVCTRYYVYIPFFCKC